MKTLFILKTHLFLFCLFIVPTSYADGNGITSENNCNGIDIHPAAKVITIEGVDCYFESEASLQELVEFYDLYFVTYRWQQSWIREYNDPKYVSALYSKSGTHHSKAFLTVTDKQPQKNIRTVSLRAGSYGDVMKAIMDDKMREFKKYHKGQPQ